MPCSGISSSSVRSIHFDCCFSIGPELTLKKSSPFLKLSRVHMSINSPPNCPISASLNPKNFCLYFFTVTSKESTSVRKEDRTPILLICVYGNQVQVFLHMFFAPSMKKSALCCLFATKANEL